MPAVTCPNCTKSLDRCFHPVGNAAPKPDDVTLCLYCHAVLVITDELGLRPMTPDEFRESCKDSGFRKSLAEALVVLEASRIGRQLLQSCN